MFCELFGFCIEVVNVFGYIVICGCMFKGGGFYVWVKKILGILFGYVLFKFFLLNIWFWNLLVISCVWWMLIVDMVFIV